MMPYRRRGLRAGAVALGALFLIACATTSGARAADPKVPPGQDPGGPALALIGGGVDYTSPKIAPRLARDGEGEPIAWDLIDNDRTPYVAAAGSDRDKAAGSGAGAPGSQAARQNGWGAVVVEDGATALAELLLSGYSQGRLVAVRLPSGDAQALAKAIAFSVGTPARIIAITQPLNTAPLREVVRQASQRFRDHVFVVAGDVGESQAGGKALPTLMNLANVLVVVSMAEVGGKPVDAVIAAADLVVMPRAGSMFGGLVGGGAPRNSREAVALAAAATACQGHGRTTPLVGSAAKAAVLDAGRPLKEAPAVRGLDPMCWYGGVRY